MMEKSCGKCVHWHNVTDFNGDDTSEFDAGECSKIEEALEIQIDAGWCGGTIESIETDRSFWCALYETREAVNK